MKVLALITVLILSTWSAQAGELLARAERDVMIKWRTLQSALDASDQLQPFSAEIEQVSPALPVDPREASGLERITNVRLTTRDHIADLLAALRDLPSYLLDRDTHRELQVDRLLIGLVIRERLCQCPRNCIRVHRISACHKYIPQWYKPPVSSPPSTEMRSPGSS